VNLPAFHSAQGDGAHGRLRRSWHAWGRTATGQAVVAPKARQYLSPPITLSVCPVDLHLGPAEAGAQAQIWVKTIPGRSWFPALGFYGPKEAYFDKTGSSTTELYNDGTGGRALQ